MIQTLPVLPEADSTGEGDLAVSADEERRLDRASVSHKTGQLTGTQPLNRGTVLIIQSPLM